MADVVQYRLERMVNELEDLERRGLFTRQEIAEIVKQRRKFEYRLKRPSPLKQDFLAYIDYETQLDSLRRLRKKSAAKETKRKRKKSVSDFAGVARIIEIYRLAVMRYKGDVDLWFKYLEFCRKRKNGRMKKALAQVIRFHPKVPGVWIYAAAWEFDHNLNVAAARALMQSGLRLCPKSEDLWVEYLRMELTYLNKLKARRVALGEDEGALTHDQKDANEKQWREENQDLFMSLNEEREGAKGSDAESEESEKKSDLFREQGLNVLQTIYGGALEALPSSFSLRRRFFEILEAIDLADSEGMHEKILTDMKRDFSADPEYWDWLAKLEIPELSTVENLSEESMQHKLLKAVKVYEEALEVVPSADLFDLYVKFLMDITFLKEGKMRTPELTGPIEKFVSQLLAVYEKAETMGYLNENLASKYVSLYLQLERLDEARELVEKLCSGQFSSSAQLWQLRVSIEVRCATRKHSSPSKEDLSSIFQLLRKVLTDISVSEAKSLWLMALDLFTDHKHYLDKFVDIAFISLAKNGGNEEGFSVSSTMVKFVLEKDGIEHAREIYKKFLALPRPSLDIYRTCIELELNLTSSGDKKSLAKVRKLFEAALSTYDQSLRLWQDYYSMEIKMGTSETANAVHWRARKTLKDAAALTAFRNY
ncbi:U3 small nucleolar RNA-associated protein 6 homolog [Punica granatum]|uniref:Uncharacterized protein n=2 Tax=Punica granatum TaxID=22663 RepID=A0A218XLK7_PUNGR|nr:U3 small nucleolar RNA-associated protein 6 homolog [Punica granatum]OWM85566.1 hypothetical protein CDL15_Pgr028989 [Punica granatum]PKI57398.1 hypothetical protein CRG98_022243 [Punica granatum]